MLGSLLISFPLEAHDPCHDGEFLEGVEASQDIRCRLEFGVLAAKLH